MITVRAGSGAIGVCLLLLAAGCSREQQDWRSAEAADTIEGYGQFIQRHPESELATQARTRVAQLGEDRDWQHAGSADTVAAYRDFIAQHPNGKWAQEAHIRIENFSLGEQARAGSAAGDPNSARANPASPGEVASPPARVAAPAAPMASRAAPVAVPAAAVAPPPAPVAVPAAPKPNSLGFGVQLGAFSSQAGAHAEWHTLASRYAPDLKGLQERVVPVDTRAGRVYRLQAAVGDEGRARALCDSLRKQGQACVAVLPH
jgi:cell division septation protein DedD